jgi:hypothetical protein
MRRLMLLALTLFAVSSYAVPVITSITPDAGSELGDTEVVIRGSGFREFPEVWFGDRRAPSVSQVNGTELRVSTPEHPPGTVTVSVRTDEGEGRLANGFTFVKETWTMTPRVGPLSGGTVVTITGPFGSWPYWVLFGETTVPGYRVNDTTLMAVTPPGSGDVRVKLLEYDVFIDTNIVFKYRVFPGDYQDRILLPLLTPPANGALGSRFHTELRALNRRTSQPAEIFGLAPGCTGTCPAPAFEDHPITIPPRGELEPDDVAYDGRPGRFIYVPKGGTAERLWLNLRVYDSTRAAHNFGTELPVVYDRELFRNEPILFPGVPADPNFRNTLRIYATAATTITVDFESSTGTKSVQVPLRPGANRFDPAYAQSGDFPSGGGPIRVVLTPPAAGEPGFGVPYWAFISVTNNDSQFITTIRP